MASAAPSIELIQEQQSGRRALLRMLAVALVVRVAVGSFIDASGFDTDLMQSWTRTLLNAPLSEFYAVAEGPDHLPGDLWFLWAIGHGLEALGLDNAPRGPFVALMKFVPAVADVVIAWELFVLVRWFATSRAALVVSAAFAFNPGGIFLTSIWGQWDAVSMAMLLGGVLVILRTACSTSTPLDRHSERSEESLREALGGVADVHRAPAEWGPHLGPASPGDPSSLRSLGMTAGEGGRGEEHLSLSRPLRGDRLRRQAALRADALRAGILRDAQDDGRRGSRNEAQSGRDTVSGTVPFWPLAIPLFTWAVLIKPPLALVAGVFVLYACVRTMLGGRSFRDAVRRVMFAILASLLLGIATASLIILPFDVGLPGMSTRWMVLERAQYALDLYPFTTLQAANIWMIKDAHLYRPGDSDGTLLGLTERTWGSLLLVIALAWIGGVAVVRWRVVRVPDVTLVVWVALAISYATFMLPTRVHERYFFPVMVLALALAGLRADRAAGWDRRGSVWSGIAGHHAGHHGSVPYNGTSSDGNRSTWPLALAISGVFLISLLFAYDHTVNAIRAALFDVPLAVLFRTVAVVNVGVFLVTMTLPLWWSRHADDRSR